ncbi:Caffeoyl-CoA O-methyltransferase [Catenulispora acidiphila DSM 44928]|uniref:Caffeoyl-CoA O-methyltransferase n=1 Tax=Catenulispora acidiphila (strain DSM 44928 / JCM 14897 / NBRC 102108 / NRRL B-24433 / ID139908) TaxID=479433 RepID=C7PY19_CATAD|nr:class I SAM-dependent methyltransferase [Catenulispora acidiphila]ACU73479.1 Caffeoyl-CoA O-methyltransferase [Catenulispora acidiphila DSM 44928]
MTRGSINLDGALQDYVVDHTTALDEVQRALIARTTELGSPSGMQIGAEQAQLLTLLVRLTNAKHAVEVGTFTGFSAIAIARGLAPGGKLLCCDVSEEWTSIGRAAWQQAGLADRIELRLAPAAETLAALPEQEYIDFAFIDADKPSYWTYYSELVPRMRAGGVIAVDNVLWSGRVVQDEPEEESTRLLKEFNDKVVRDERVDVVMLPVGDGVSLMYKR